MTGRRTRRIVGVAAVVAAAVVAAWFAPPGLGVQERTNRLIHEKSPYLLLHARNPVDWYPWGEEAFERARREGKPIFLSIGYSTCHWCHVMEHESFSNPTIAALLNRHFVSIKVDREERPDLDSVYMAYVQAATGRGGWPMSVFLTPDLEPFFGGTYFPPEDRGGRPGFATVLERLAEAWAQDRERVLEAAGLATKALRAAVETAAGGVETLTGGALDRTYEQLRSNFDATHWGFGTAPKFPRPVVFSFLLRYHRRTGQPDALKMTLETLRAMARGGMHDQLGGGFHRYSTDRTWHVPHFEKMLYDQAQLAIAYLEAYQLTREPVFARTARAVLDYVLRDLRGPAGELYSAEDADSLVAAGRPERAEGAFYVWTAAEIAGVLDDETARMVGFHYGVEADGNVPARQDIQGELRGKNVLAVRHTVEETAAELERPVTEVAARVAEARRRLLDARARRPRPPLDDKVLTAWNGLMVSAFARAAQVLDAPEYLAAASAAAEFVRAELYDAPTRTLARRYRDGDAAIDGFLDDYAFLIQGLLDLYEASFDVAWLSWADRLQERQDALFWDARQGGYFSSGDADPSVLVRMRTYYDGAEPSANSVAAMNLLRLWQMTGREEWRARADETFGAFAPRFAQEPTAAPQLAAALDFSLSKPKQIVIAGQADARDTQALLRVVHARFLPHKILLLADGGPGQARLAQGLPFIESMAPREGRAQAYICEDYICKLPTTVPAEVARQLDAQPVR